MKLFKFLCAFLFIIVLMVFLVPVNVGASILPARASLVNDVINVVDGALITDVILYQLISCQESATLYARPEGAPVKSNYRHSEVIMSCHRHGIGVPCRFVVNFRS